MSTSPTREHLRRIRWAVRGTLLLGVAASVVANVLHAVHNPISQSIAAWPPLALLLTVELISRIPAHSRVLGAARITAAAVIAGIAAWVSYGHMSGVAARYGETGASPYLLPLSVDGLIVVASICLVELGTRIRQVDQGGNPEPAPEPVMIRLDHDHPIGPMPAPKPRTTRPQPRALTVAQRIIAAHAKDPAASHDQIAARAKVSVSSVKRHRPTGSPSAPDAGKTIIDDGSREPVEVTG